MLESLELDPRLKFRAAAFVPRVIRVNSFDEDSVAEFSAEMAAAHRTGQSVIPIIIDSYGGDTYACLAMCDIVKTSRVPVATIVQGKAMSSGAILFTCGTAGYRFMGENATLMIHDAANSTGWKKSEEIKADAKETDRINKKIYRLIDRNCGLPNGYSWDLVQKRARADWYLNPKQAVQHGYANHIGVPSLRTRVTIETSLDF